MLQQVARCRDIEVLYFCFQKKKFNKCNYIDFIECKKELTARGEFAKGEFNALEEHEVQRQELFNNLYTEYLYKMDAYNTNKYCHFKRLLKIRGFNVCSFNRATNKCDQDKINQDVLNWKMKDFDIDSEQLAEFNDKYLQLTKAQLLDCKDLFIKDELMGCVFKLKNYFEYGLKHKPLFNAAKEYESVKDDEMFKDITAEQLATKYDADITYDKLTDTEEMKIKKVNTNAYKYYMIDKLKVLCDYKEIRKETIAEFIDEEGNKIEAKVNATNVITARQDLNAKDKTDFIKAYKIVFNHRGKTDPKLNTNYDCEKMITNMLKKTFGKDIMKDALKVRDGKKVKYQHSINYDSEILNISRKIVNYKRINMLKENMIDKINGGQIEYDFIDC
jgi:hypothetical protein